MKSLDAVWLWCHGDLTEGERRQESAEGCVVGCAAGCALVVGPYGAVSADKCSSWQSCGNLKGRLNVQQTVLRVHLQGGCRHMQAVIRTPSALRCGGPCASIAAVSNIKVFNWHLYHTQTSFIRRSAWPKGGLASCGMEQSFFLFCFELHAVMSELHMMSCKHEVSRCKGCCVILCYFEGWFSMKIQIQTAHRVLVSPGMQRAVNGLKRRGYFPPRLK